MGYLPHGLLHLLPTQLALQLLRSPHIKEKILMAWLGAMTSIALFQVKIFTVKFIQTNLPGCHLQADHNYWLVKIGKLSQTSFSSSTPSSDLHTKICSVFLPGDNKLFKLTAGPFIPNEELSTDTVLS